MKLALHQYAVIDSTNDEAKRLLEQGAKEGTVVQAGRQTAGRGRQGRLWVSEPGNLYFSLILHPCCNFQQISQLSYVIALASGKCLASFLEDPDILTYKWPNDLLLAGQKVGGILIETVSHTLGAVDACIAGVGINIASGPFQKNGGTGYPVTTLHAHSKVTLTPDSLCLFLFENIDFYYRIWQTRGFEPLRQEWLARAHGLGKDITVKAGTEMQKGKFLGIDPKGALMLGTPQPQEGGEGEDITLHFMSAEITGFSHPFCERHN